MNTKQPEQGKTTFYPKLKRTVFSTGTRSQGKKICGVSQGGKRFVESARLTTSRFIRVAGIEVWTLYTETVTPT